MIRLLRANMARLVKSATFWVCVALYALYAIIFPIIAKSWRFTSDQALTWNYGILGSGFPAQGILIAIICVIFLGTDFHNGMYKNLIIIGQSKTNIYLANLLTSFIMSMALNAVFLLFFFLVAMPLLGGFTQSASTVFWVLVNGTLMMTSYSSLMTFTMMTSKNTIVSLIIIFLILFLGGMWFFTMLNVIATEPELILVRGHDMAGNEWCEYWPNPNLESKPVRDLCQFLLDLFPSGQSMQISRYGGYTHGWQMALYSLGLIGATSGAGIAIFKKSNIK